MIEPSNKTSLFKPVAGLPGACHPSSIYMAEWRGQLTIPRYRNSTLKSRSVVCAFLEIRASVTCEVNEDHGASEAYLQNDSWK
jgi:hypothetical protein